MPIHVGFSHFVCGKARKIFQLHGIIQNFCNSFEKKNTI